MVLGWNGFDCNPAAILAYANFCPVSQTQDSSAKDLFSVSERFVIEAAREQPTYTR